MNFILIIKIIIIKFFRLNISFIKREISGYPKSVQKFENEFARYIGKKFGLTFCNGTSSIEAALFALQLSENDEVLVPSSTFHATIGPILNLNLKPIFIEINPQTLTIDCIDLEKKITNNSKALLIVHPWGNPCNMDKILEIIKINNLKLIEDCSHAHGATYDNKKIGSFGDISCFSLQGGKSVAAGEGGISITDKNEYFLRMSAYGHFNRHEKKFLEDDKFTKFTKTGISKKLRAHPLGISIASVDFDYLDKINLYKKDIYNKIDQILKKFKSITQVELNQKAERGGFFGGYPILFKDLKNINSIKNIFTKNNIKIFPYPWLLHHKLDVFSKEEVHLSVTEDISQKFYFIKIPFFLNFNFKNLEKCLLECKKNNLIE
jgi:perosamine synthetase